MHSCKHVLQTLFIPYIVPFSQRKIQIHTRLHLLSGCSCSYTKSPISNNLMETLLHTDLLAGCTRWSSRVSLMAGKSTLTCPRPSLLSFGLYNGRTALVATMYSSPYYHIIPSVIPSQLFPLSPSLLFYKENISTHN